MPLWEKLPAFYIEPMAVVADREIVIQASQLQEIGLTLEIEGDELITWILIVHKHVNSEVGREAAVPTQGSARET